MTEVETEDKFSWLPFAILILTVFILCLWMLSAIMPEPDVHLGKIMDISKSNESYTRIFIKEKRHSFFNWVEYEKVCAYDMPNKYLPYVKINQNILYMDFPRFIIVDKQHNPIFYKEIE